MKRSRFALLAVALSILLSGCDYLPEWLPPVEAQQAAAQAQTALQQSAAELAR